MILSLSFVSGSLMLSVFIIENAEYIFRAQKRLLINTAKIIKSQDISELKKQSEMQTKPCEIQKSSPSLMGSLALVMYGSQFVPKMLLNMYFLFFCFSFSVKLIKNHIQRKFFIALFIFSF